MRERYASAPRRASDGSILTPSEAGASGAGGVRMMYASSKGAGPSSEVEYAQMTSEAMY
jgi:hypothetical protein